MKKSFIVNLIGIFLLISLFFTNCRNPEMVDTYKKYTIKENSHRTYVSGLTNPYIVKFDSTIIYNLGNKNQYDLNKLPGWREGINPRVNSHRIGFRWSTSDSVIEMYYYEYKNSERIFKEQISDSLLYGVFEIGEDVLISYPDSLKINTNIYFGGNEKAPHDINIYIQNKND